MGNFVIKQATQGEYYFDLIEDNPMIILTSQLYSSKSSCFQGIDLVRNSSYSDGFERKQTVNNNFYFVLKTSEGQIIGNSGLYASQTGMENGIESIKKSIDNIKVVEEDPIPLIYNTNR
jgi:hypothetical protein